MIMLVWPFVWSEKPYFFEDSAWLPCAIHKR